jgi:phosphotransferase system HPr-like phosphotransfer protein
MNEAREVFRCESREGHHIRLIVAGEIDEAVLDGLEDFIAWRRRLEVPAPSTDADV